MSALEPQEYVTDETDGRGRLQVGADRAGAKLTYVVYDPDDLERVEGPSTKTVAKDGRLSLGSEFAGEEVTLGIIDVEEVENDE